MAVTNLEDSQLVILDRLDLAPTIINLRFAIRLHSDMTSLAPASLVANL